MLKIENLNTGYDKKQILFNVSFDMKQGDITLLVGSNGSGKSTLLKAIFSLCKVWNGDVYFNSENITNKPSNELLKKGLLYIPQKNNVFEQLTVKENLEISGLALHSKTLYIQRYQALLDNFPTLIPFLDKHPMKMSGGERQQLVLAMAMLHQPKLLLLDEPFTGLSPKAIEDISNKIKQINTVNKTTIIMVEHLITEALPLANQVIGLKLGNIVQNSPKNSNFTNEFFQQILI